MQVSSEETNKMNLTIRGHHVTVTPALREYILAKLARTERQFDQVIDVTVLLTYKKHKDKEHRNTVHIDLHVKGKDFHVERVDGDMYATIDSVTDALHRKVVEHKNKVQSHHRGSKPSLAAALQ
jgi:putative sigma-54 modulation protein